MHGAQCMHEPSATCVHVYLIYIYRVPTIVGTTHTCMVHGARRRPQHALLSLMVLPLHEVPPPSPRAPSRSRSTTASSPPSAAQSLTASARSHRTSSSSLFDVLGQTQRPIHCNGVPIELQEFSGSTAQSTYIMWTLSESYLKSEW
jgi:hypothetical protein